jgi:glycosyltransferase involved in cell wall biosynthesis
MGRRGRRTVLVVASPSWRFGWGVYAINMALHWFDDPELAPLAIMPFKAGDILGPEALPPAWRERLAAFAESSLGFQKYIASLPGALLDVSVPVLHPVYDQMRVAPIEGERYVFGKPTIGMVFSIDTALDHAAHERARRFALIVAGSRWNQQVVESAGIGPTALVLQGIEPSLFHPGTGTSRFAIFSGGKLEYRKGQDLVMRAFRQFHARHRDALLVTAWHSPWPGLSQSLAGTDMPAPPLDGEGHNNVLGWAAMAGLPADAVLDLGAVPQPKMPAILRDMDAADFPNRCECGTNLVAMECMACGVPTVLSANTGHLDLMEPDNCYALSRQRPVDPGKASVAGAEGWGESDIEEIVEQLEAIYGNRGEALRRGARGAATLARLTWARQINALKTTILPYLD